MPTGPLPAAVRRSCAAVTAAATAVSIDHERLASFGGDLADAPAPTLDAGRHFLEGNPADVATYILVLDAVNFGSGWFPTLRKRVGDDGRTVSGATSVAWWLGDRFRAHGAWTPTQLRAIGTAEVADVLHQRRDHELMALYAQALRELGRFLGPRTALDVVTAAEGSAVSLATTLAGSMTMWRDPGFAKRAQLTPSDLQLAGVAKWDDLHELTIFADNLVPHVLRCDGVLRLSQPLASAIDEGRGLPVGPWERELRAAAVTACAAIAPRLGMSEATLDGLLWNRGQGPAYKARPRARCRCVSY